MIDLSKLRLLGTKCVVNISQKSKIQGLAVLSTDPRKWRIKPDAYEGIVEEIGPTCSLVKVGDRVVIERWTYKQTDIDDERILGDESQVLVYQRKNQDGWGEETPTLGVVVMRLLKNLPKTQLTLPDAAIERQRKKDLLYQGVVTNSGSGIVKAGDMIWVERRERHQFRTPDGRLIFINVQDSWGQYPIWMIAEKEVV